MNRHILSSIKRLKIYEVYLFWLIVLVHLWPLLSSQVMLTADGPAHLYNARLLITFLTQESPLEVYYELNSFILPNWLSHSLLAGLMNFIPALMADKILLGAYLVLFPLAFRFCALSFTIKNRALLYFIFPFTYSFLFFFGFYNFHLGLVICFFAFGIYFRYQSKTMSWQGLFILMLLAILTYWAHLFVFLILMGVVAAAILLDLRSKKERKTFSKRGLQFLIIFSPGIIMGTFFLIQHQIEPSSIKESLSLSDAWDRLKNIEPARAVKYGKEGIFTKWLFYLYLLLLADSLFKKLKNRKQKTPSHSLLWAGLSTLFIIALTIIPQGSIFLGPRIFLFFFLFLTLFLATTKLNPWFKLLAFLVVSYVNIALLKIYSEVAKSNELICMEIIELGKRLEENSIILPVNQSNNWLLGHASNYLGIEKPQLILENYEASLDYFSLSWDHAYLENWQLAGNNSHNINYPFNASNQQMPINYLFVLKGRENSSLNIQNELDLDKTFKNYYALTYESKGVLLYELKEGK